MKLKDPYLKPVIFGGLTTALLSVVFAPGIFIWSIVGGYVTSRLSHKLTKEIFPLIDCFLLGLFSGIVGATVINIVTVFSFQNPENRRILIKTLEKNWPRDMTPIPDFSEVLPTIFLATSILIVVITVIFSTIGSYIGLILNKRNANR